MRKAGIVEPTETHAINANPVSALQQFPAVDFIRAARRPQNSDAFSQSALGIRGLVHGTEQSVNFRVRVPEGQRVPVFHGDVADAVDEKHCLHWFV